VITAIKFMYNYIPMIMCAIIFVMMLLFFNLEKDLKKLKAEKGYVDAGDETADVVILEDSVEEIDE